MSDPVKFITHIALYVGDLERSIRWYEDVMGMKINASSPGRFAAVSFGYRHHDLALVQAPPDYKPVDTDRVGVYHMAIDTGSFDNSMRIYGKARELGMLDFVKATDHRLGVGIYLRDPDGNIIELWSEYHKRMDDAIASIDKMDPPFEENPIGFPMDMEETWRKWSAEHGAAAN